MRDVDNHRGDKPDSGNEASGFTQNFIRGTMAQLYEESTTRFLEKGFCPSSATVSG